MINSVYDMVVSMIGTLPTNLEFIYAIITLLVSVVIVTLPFFPFIALWKIIKR